MKHYQTFRLAILATLLIIPFSCKKEDAPVIETPTAEFSLVIHEYRGWNPKLYTWRYSNGSLSTSDQSIQTMNVTSDTRIEVVVTSSDPAFTGVSFSSDGPVEATLLTEKEISAASFKGYKGERPNGAQVWLLNRKDDGEGAARLTFSAGSRKVTFPVNVTKDVPIEAFLFRLDGGEVKRIAPCPLHIASQDAYYVGVFEHYDYEDEWPETMKYVLGGYVGPEDFNYEDVLHIIEFLGIEPENTTYSTLKNCNNLGNQGNTGQLGMPEDSFSIVYGDYVDEIAKLPLLNSTCNAKDFHDLIGKVFFYRTVYIGSFGGIYPYESKRIVRGTVIRILSEEGYEISSDCKWNEEDLPIGPYEKEYSSAVKEPWNNPDDCSCWFVNRPPNPVGAWPRVACLGVMNMTNADCKDTMYGPVYLGLCRKIDMDSWMEQGYRP